MKRTLLLRGFSILEFMIAITLGFLVVSAVATTYISNRNIHALQESLSRLQENARYVSYLLARDIRMAGYSGCANRKNITISNLTKNNSALFDFSVPLLGYSGSSSTFTPALPANLVGESVLNSDVLEIRYGSNDSVQLQSDMVQTNTPVLV